MKTLRSAFRYALRIRSQDWLVCLSVFNQLPVSIVIVLVYTTQCVHLPISPLMEQSSLSQPHQGVVVVVAPLATKAGFEPTAL